MFLGKKIFITGGTGFIGSNLTKTLLSKGANLYVLSRKNTSSENSTSNIKYIKGNILNSRSFLPVLKECDIVFHCASKISFLSSDAASMYKVNVDGSRNIFEASLGSSVKKIIHLSACSVFGHSLDPDNVINETHPLVMDKANGYARSKGMAEEVVLEYVKRGLDISIANIATVYGYGDKDLNSGTIIKGIYRDKIKFVPPGGTSYVTMADLINGLMLLAEKGKRGERYIFSNESLTFFELFNRIADILEKKGIKHILPRWTCYPLSVAAYFKNKLSLKNIGKIDLITPDIIKGSFHYKYYDPGKANKELGWIPKASLREAVNEAMDFYIKEGLL